MSKLKDFFHYDAWTLLLDAIAVNLAYFLALVIRFYINFHFTSNIGHYLEYFYAFAPFYTVIAIAVFCLFRLYGGVWIYAGLNDMNRIIMASAVTAVIQIAGTLLFVGRMPISYYVIGAFLQYVFVSLIRFSYRFIMMEKGKIAKRFQESIPVLIVGSGDYGRKLLHHLEHNTPFQPVVIAGRDVGRNLDGVPVVPLDAIADQIKARGIKAVFIADDTLTADQRKSIGLAAEGLDIRDYTGFLSNMTGSIPVSSILEVTEGPVTLVLNGQERRFTSAHDAMITLTQRYEVKSITAPRIELEKGSGTDESWIREYEEQTGEDVSFF